MRKFVFLLLGIGIGVLSVLGIFKAVELLSFGRPGLSENNSAVLIEQVREVFKLGVVEGDLAEIFEHKDLGFFNLPGFRKSALLKVEAKVLVGFDFNNLEITADEGSRTIFIHGIPKPSILSVDPEIHFYDMEEGLFNTFDEKGLTELYSAAKDTLRNKAERSSLIAKAEQQTEKMLAVLESMLTQVGWDIVVVPSETKTDVFELGNGAKNSW